MILLPVVFGFIMRKYGKKLPQEAISGRNRHELLFLPIGRELADEEMGPLHPAALSRDTHAERERQDDPTGRIAPRLLP